MRRSFMAFVDAVAADHTARVCSQFAVVPAAQVGSGWLR